MQAQAVYVDRAAAAAAAAPRAQTKTRRVVDAPMRMFHWLFALCFAGAYLTAEGESLRALHVTLGYTMAGLLVFRLGYGLFGPRHARLSNLWRKLSGAGAWLRSLWPWPLGRPAAAPSAAWRQGQNLAMALAVVLLLVLTVPLTLTGYGAFNDWPELFAELHEATGEAMLFVVLAHLALIALLSLLRKKNIAAPMLSGRTEGAGADLVKHNRVWLAVLILACALGYGAWEWHNAPNGLINTTAVFGSGAQHGHGHDHSRGHQGAD